MPAKMTPTMMQMQACGTALAAINAEAGAAPDAAPDCTGSCVCTTCPVEALTCLSDPMCKAIVDCAAEKNCTDPISCAGAANCGAVLAANATALPAAIAFQCCGNTCTAKCPKPEGGTPEGGVNESSTNDAPAETSSSADADNDGG
jgi:hypothetical protein